MNMIADPRKHLVVIGNGMAGMRTVEELLARDEAHRYRITVFGAEPHVNYNRIMLSSVLAGDKSLDDIVINPQDWYDDNGIRLYRRRPGRAHRSRREDRHRRERPHAFRTTRCCSPPARGRWRRRFRASACPASAPSATSPTSTRCWKPHAPTSAPSSSAAGCSAWKPPGGSSSSGMSVALVHLMPTLMERQLDAAAGQLLQRDLDRRGIAFFTNGQTEEILGTDHAEGVQLADGRTIPADLVVLAIGIRPNIDLARAAGLEVNRGIKVVRRHAHQRPGYLRGRRMRGASRPGVRPGGAAVGSGQGRAPPSWPATRRRCSRRARCRPA